MTAEVEDPGASAVVSIPDLRDYDRINAELVRRLDEGCPRVRLVGAEGQRFLAAGLAGDWRAVVEVEGRAGPELGARLDAPGVTLVCRGPAADGAAASLRAGRVVILGDAGVALGYAQEGGEVVAAASAGPRAGLNQRGGTLAILGCVGPLAGERQAGGRLFAQADRIGPHARRGSRGGRLVVLAPGPDRLQHVPTEDAEAFRSLLSGLAAWLPHASAEAPGHA